MNTKPFTIEGCKANNNEAVTKGGRKVVIVSYSNPFKPQGMYKLAGFVDGHADPSTWRTDGSFSNGPCDMDLVLPHKPTLRPWTPQEAIGKVVERKTDGNLYVVVGAWEDGAYLMSDFKIRYDALLSEYIQPDGSPCGVEE